VLKFAYLPLFASLGVALFKKLLTSGAQNCVSGMLLYTAVFWLVKLELNGDHVI